MSEAASEPVTILVVDDDPAMRALLRDWLEREGFQIIEEPSAERLLAVAQTARFDALILDKEMPGTGGFDVLPAFRRLRSDVPVILITAFGGAMVAQEALKLGAREYLEKPFQLRTLLEVVREATAVASRRRAAGRGQPRPVDG
jgi:two-component system C4-dicarboxylate transport response regulator DctD